MLTVKEIKLGDDIDWDELIKKSSTATFFQTREWLKLWVRHFKSEVKIIGVFDGENMAGIAPLEIRENRIDFLGVNSILGGELVSDFGDIIAINGREKEVWEEVLSQISPGRSSFQDKPFNHLPGVSKIEFNFVREDSPSFKILQELGRRAEEMDVAPYIDLPNTWEEYLGGLDRHDRHELRRKMRKIETEGVTLSDYKGDINEIEEFFRLMTLGNEQKRSFLSSEMKDFFQDIIKTFYKSKLALTFLKKEKDYLAAALTFLYKDEVLLYNSGFDPKYSHLAPGLILKAYLIKRAIGNRRKKFDFLRGGERYKHDFGGRERRLYKVKLV